VRDTFVEQTFDHATSTLTGSPISLPGTEGVSSFPGTGRTSVTISADGTLLYSTGGTGFQLGWFKPDGTPLGTVGPVDEYISLRLSPDGNEALVQIRDPAARADLWRIDLARGGRDQLTSDGGGSGGWSPDGQRIAFSLPSGLDPQTMNSRGGGGARLPLNTDVQVYPSDWSREGDSLVYTESSADTSNNIWRWPMAGEGKPTALAHSTANERHGQLGRDGRWLVFTSNASGRDEVYVQHWSDARTQQRVSNTGGSYPRWDPGGRELWYRASDGRLTRVPVRFVGASIELGAAVATTLRLPDPPAIHWYPYDVGPDGRILALIPAAEGSPQLAVLMNWQTALEP
jgi:Tol biopolymer transport system component